MFSEMIQGLLNSGGKAAAMQRASQINNYVKNVDRQLNPQQARANSALDTIYPPNADSVQSFEKVLSNSKAVNFGSLLLNPNSLNVNGNIYNENNITNATLKRAIQEVNDATRVYNPDAVNASTNKKSQLLNMINQVANKHGVDERLVQALIKQESGFNPNAKSKAGALGLMQLMPSTAKALGVADPLNPTQNVEGGEKPTATLLCGLTPTTL